MPAEPAPISCAGDRQGSSHLAFHPGADGRVARDPGVHPRHVCVFKSMPAELCLTEVANRNCVKIVINPTGVYPMPTSLPDTYPTEIVVDVPSIRLPPGTWLIVGWTVVMLAVGFY